MVRTAEFQKRTENALIALGILPDSTSIQSVGAGPEGTGESPEGCEGTSIPRLRFHDWELSARPWQIDVHQLGILLADVTGVIEDPYSYGVRTGAADADGRGGCRHAAHRAAVQPIENLADAAAGVAGNDRDRYGRAVVRPGSVRRGCQAQARSRRREIHGSGCGQEEDAADWVQGQTHVSAGDRVSCASDGILQHGRVGIIGANGDNRHIGTRAVVERHDGSLFPGMERA